MFEYKKLNEKGLEKVESITRMFEQALEILVREDYGIGIPEGRELSIVKTKLEEACFFAKKAVSSQPENQA